MTVSEYSLKDYAICPLYQLAEYLSLVESCPRLLLQWLLLEAFNGRIVPLYIIRNKFVKYWNDGFEGKKESKEYWEGPRAGVRIAKKYFDLVSDYEVLRPIEPYTFQMGSHAVEGRYAVIHKRVKDGRFKEEPMVLVIQPQRPKYARQPDIVGLVRWCNEMQSCQYVKLGIFYLSMLSNERPWKHRGINEPLARTWVRNILDSMSNLRSFAVPGGHCATCIGKACMGVFQ